MSSRNIRRSILDRVESRVDSIYRSCARRKRQHLLPPRESHPQPFDRRRLFRIRGAPGGKACIVLRRARAREDTVQQGRITVRGERFDIVLHVRRARDPCKRGHFGAPGRPRVRPERLNTRSARISLARISLRIGQERPELQHRALDELLRRREGHAEDMSDLGKRTSNVISQENRLTRSARQALQCALEVLRSFVGGKDAIRSVTHMGSRIDLYVSRIPRLHVRPTHAIQRAVSRRGEKVCAETCTRRPCGAMRPSVDEHFLRNVFGIVTRPDDLIRAPCQERKETRDDAVEHRTVTVTNLLDDPRIGLVLDVTITWPIR